MTDLPTFPPFSLSRLLKTVFAPEGGERVAILIDLADPAREVKDWAFLDDPRYSVQKHAHDAFYQALKNGVAEELGLQGGDFYAYKVTGGSNLELPDEAYTPDGRQVSLERDVYPNYDIILCISTYSATAPLTAFAKKIGFKGATLHGVNDVILSSGLAVDYNEVSREAERLRLGLTRADRFEIDFEFGGRKETLTLHTNGQEAQKSHGLCHGKEPDVANLPAGEVYYVPESADGKFPLKYESDGSIAVMTVKDGYIRDVEFLSGSIMTVNAHRALIKADASCGEIGELGFGTQLLPVSGADIQDEKIRGTVHVATGRSDHLGGKITPDKFENAGHATHDDILFAPHKTPEIMVTQVRMVRDGETTVTHEHYRPSAYLLGLLEG